MPRNRSEWKYVVDPEYAEQVCSMRWRRDKSGYLRTHQHGQAKMHNLVWELAYGEKPKPGTVDHKNRVPWDNRASNLRLTTLSGQQLNRRCRKRDLPPGVSFDRRRKKRPYQAMLKRHGKNASLGNFATPEEASAVYERARAEAIADEETKACQSTVKR